MQVTIVFAPTIQSPKGPIHEQVFFEGGIRSIEYAAAPDRVIIHFEDGTTSSYNFAQVREVVEDPVGKVRPNSLKSM